MAICNDNGTGSITVTLPNSTNLLSSFKNTVGVAYTITLKSTSDGTIRTNYNLIARIDDKACPGPGDFLLLTASSGDIFTFSNIPAGAYLVTIEYFKGAYYTKNSKLYVPSPCTSTSSVRTYAAINLDSCNTDVYGCTDPVADNYNSLATVDDGSCILPALPGCTDPNARNFSAFATSDSGICQYDINACTTECSGVTTVVPACIPNNIDELLEYNKKCIAASGNRYYTKHITGLSDSCSNMDSWKMLIINDLMSRKGLPCLYNCTDANTPSLEDASIDCLQIWKDAGSVAWDPAKVKTYVDGSVVLRNNAVYTATGDSGIDIDPASTNSINGWRKCNDLAIKNESKNYLPNFLKFAEQYCKDCNIPSYRQDDPQAVQISDTYSVGGNIITINGSSLNT